MGVSAEEERGLPPFCGVESDGREQWWWEVESV